MLQHLFSSYVKIDEIDREENSVNMMGPYDPIEPLARLIKNWKMGESSRKQGGRQFMTP